MQNATTAAETTAGRPPHSPPATRDRLIGIGLMCIATMLFSALDATAKYLGTVAQLPMTQVVWLRFLSQFGVIVLALGLVAVPRLVRTEKLGLQLGRSFLMMLSTATNFIALKYLRLDQTQTIYFLTPLTVALLAGPFLGEWVGWRRLIAILVGFCGIIVAVRPGLDGVHPAVLFALASMLAYAIFTILTRHLSKYDPTEVTLFYSLLAGAYFMAPLAIIDWVWPQSWQIWLLLFSMGFWGGLGHYLLILAYRRAQAPVVAPFIYVGLLTHSTAGYFIFGDVPDTWTVAGAAIVIASGIYLFNRERKVKSGAD